MNSTFSAEDHWKAVTLYGLNTATYKIALAKSLLAFCEQGLTEVSWDILSNQFFNEYLQRLETEDPMPQLGQPGKRTVMEKIVGQFKRGSINEGRAVELVGKDAFKDVIRRFHNIGSHGDLSESMFYKYEFGKRLVLTDATHSLWQVASEDLNDELGARWGLLEGAFAKNQGNFKLANDLRVIYIENGTIRKNLTQNIPFLQAYQGNSCFYCGELIQKNHVHVDHVLPRQVVEHDHIWNLVLAHEYCNEQKSDRVVGNHYIEKLIARNENIMGSNHPMKKDIEIELGETPKKRSDTLKFHYDRVCKILNRNYWGGDSGYSPNSDPFYRKLITLLNNKNP